MAVEDKHGVYQNAERGAVGAFWIGGDSTMKRTTGKTVGRAGFARMRSASVLLSRLQAMRRLAPPTIPAMLTRLAAT